MAYSKIVFPFFIVLLWLTPQYFYAQSVDSSETKVSTPTTYISAGVSYNSQVVYQGRTDDISQFSVAPNLRFQHKSGFFAGYSGDIWSKETNPYSRTTLGLGYEFDISEDWSLGMKYDHWTLHNGTTKEKNALTNNVSLDLSYAPSTWIFSAMPSISAGTIKAFGMDLLAYKIFTFGNVISQNDKIMIMPNLDITIATDNRFSASRLKRALLSTKKISQQQTKVRSYQIAIPVKYRKTAEWSVGATLYYAIPVNLTLAEKNMKNIAYFALDFSYYLWKTKA
jgi:hypothetical protein